MSSTIIIGTHTGLTCKTSVYRPYDDASTIPDPHAATDRERLYFPIVHRCICSLQLSGLLITTTVIVAGRIWIRGVSPGAINLMTRWLADRDLKTPFAVYCTLVRQLSPGTPIQNPLWHYNLFMTTWAKSRSSKKYGPKRPDHMLFATNGFRLYRNALASCADFIVVGREMHSVDQLRGY